jgi:hypothetical protein
VNPNPINVHYQTTVAYPGATALPGPAAAPNYAAPGCTNCAPATSPAFPTVPQVQVNPGTTLGAPPAATYPAPAGSSGGGTAVPADQPPNLNAPASGSYQGSSYRPAPAQPITPPDALAPSGISSGSNSAKPASEPPASPGTTRDLQLIPYPGNSEPAESSAPPLLNGRGKTASLSSEEPWSYTLISWPERTEARRAKDEAPAIDLRPAAPPIATLDDGGWRAARSR